MSLPLRPVPIAGVVLAGGLGRRFGGVDKAFVDLDGRPLIGHVIDRFAPQVAPLMISANGDPERFSAFGLPVVADPQPDRPGPLAGLAAAGLWLRAHRPEIDLVATVAVDLPALPLDLVERLASALTVHPQARVAVARSGERLHPVVALHRLDGLDGLVAGLADGSVRRVVAWVEGRGAVTVDFEGADGGDPFVNVNTAADLAAITKAGGVGKNP